MGEERTDPRCILAPFPPLPTTWAPPAPLPKLHPSSAYNMGDQSRSSRFQVVFESALYDYERQTGITLAEHPLARQLQACDAVESITALIREQAWAFSEFRESDKITALLEGVVSFLSRILAAADFGLVCFWPPNGLSTVSDAYSKAIPT